MIEISVNEDNVVNLVEIITSYNIFFVNFLQRDGFFSIFADKNEKIYYESQFEDVVTETYTAETDQGGTAIANGDGTVTVNDESKLHEDN